MVLRPNSNKCIEYYYDVMEVVEGNEDEIGIKHVKKGDLIAYTNSKERLKLAFKAEMQEVVGKFQENKILKNT
jgi:hypothetical protein